MTTAKLCASTILTAFGDVQSELVGKAVVLTDGKPARSRAFGWTNCTACESPQGARWEMADIDD
jgi:hypothetical protein